MADDEKPTETGRGPLALIAAGALALALIASLVLLIWRRDDAGEGNASAAAGVVGAPAEAPANAVAAAPVAPTIQTRPQAEQLAAAFAAAFGGPPPVTRAIDGNDIVYRPSRLRWIGERAVLVSTGTNRSDCHACAGHLAVHYLVPAGEGFRVVGAWLDGGGSADWGHPPDWSFSTLLSEQPMIRSEGGGGGQGFFCSWSRFYELRPNGPHEIADVQTGFSDRGFRVPENGVAPTEYQGMIRHAVRDRSFDMVYTVRDFVASGGEYAPAGRRHLTEHYVLRGGRYVLRSGESRVPTC